MDLNNVMCSGGVQNRSPIGMQFHHWFLHPIISLTLVYDMWALCGHCFEVDTYIREVHDKVCS